MGLEEYMSKAMFLELLDAIRAGKKEDEKESKLFLILAIIGGIVAVAAIAYGVYRFLTPDYFDDYDDDDDFDDDDFFDDDEDDFEDEEEDEEEEAEEPAEEPDEEPAEEKAEEE